MKKMAVILMVTFFTSIGVNTYASTLVIDNSIQITLLENDKKPCPAGCTCENCKAKAADVKNTSTTGEASADSKKEGECAKKCEGKSAETKKPCCSKATETKTETTSTEKK